MSRKRKTLPKKLSALLRLAVRDAQAIEKMDGYELYMYNYHRPAYGDTCYVCMAGAVMATSLGADRRKSTGPSDFGALEGRLRAIDGMREGLVDFAAELAEINLTDDQVSVARDVGEFIRDRIIDIETGRAPWRTYLAAANRLEKAGL